MEKRFRDPYVDILKGIGIVSVVIGHSGALFPGWGVLKLGDFVYMYHLMIFFFAGGMVYRPEKQASLLDYGWKQVSNASTLYYGYSILFLLLHNLLARLSIVNQPLYIKRDLFSQGLQAVVFHSNEQMLGAMWFVPTFLLSKAIFGAGFWVAEKLPLKKVFHVLFALLMAGTALYMNIFGLTFAYRFHISVLGVPIIYLGYIFARYRQKLEKFLNPVTCILSAAALYAVIFANVGGIELSANRIISPVLFYPVTAVGILFCLSFAKILQLWKPLGKLMAYLGNISFHIMALHFLAAKVVDRLAALILGRDPATTMGFPHAFSDVGIVYTVAGIAGPALLVYFVRKLREKYQNKLLPLKNNH